MNDQKISILLCTYNGEQFIEEQLYSIERQSFKNWDVHASDDKSTDNTLNILKYFQKRWGSNKLKIYTGPGKGYSANFMNLLGNKKINADYYAFADQDDVWNEDKLSKAISSIYSAGQNKSALYCSRTELIDEFGHSIGLSKYRNFQINFNNSLLENIAGGNTMVFNQFSRNLLAKISSSVLPVISHDWTLFQLVTGSDGYIFYDEWASIKYRQHGKNLIGSNSSIISNIIRLTQFILGRYRYWINVNLHALGSVKFYLSDSAMISLSKFQSLRNEGFIGRILRINNFEFNRSTKLQTIIIIIGHIFGRV
jgi:glycosyltransferase involved in cell wall biosynthesis